MPEKPANTNEDYTALSKALFLLLVSLAAALGSWSVYRARFLAESIASGTASWWTVPATLLVATTLLVAFRRATLERESPTQSAGYLQELALSLARDLAIAAPEVRISRSEHDARVAISASGPYIVAPPAMEVLARVNPETIRPVLLHELAHIANGDARAAQLAQALMMGCVALVAGVAFAEFLAYVDGLRLYAQRYGAHRITTYEAGRLLEPLIWILPFVLALAFTYAAFLRMREFEADRVVARHGHGEAMAVALLQTTNSVRNRLRMHPSPVLRAKSLRERASIHFVEVETLVLASATSWLITSVAAALPKAVGIAAFACAFVLSAVVMSLMGINVGRRVSVDGGTFFAKSRQFLKAIAALSIGAIGAVLFLDITIYFTAGTPLRIDASEAFVQGCAASFGMSAAFALGFAIGSSTAGDMLPSGAVRYLWLALTMLVSIVAYVTAIFWVHALLDTAGLTFQAKWWHHFSVAIREHPQVMLVLPPQDEWRIGPDGFALASVTIVGSFLIALLLALRVAKSFSTRLLRSDTSPRLTQIMHLVIVVLVSVIPTVLLGRMGIDAGMEVTMNPSMWVSCTTSHLKNANGASSVELNHAAAFSNDVFSMAVSVAKVTTQAPSFFVGMANHDCRSMDIGRYPRIRALLAKAGLVEDLYVNLAFAADGTVKVTSKSEPSEETLLILEGKATTLDVAKAVTRHFFPYRTTLKEIADAGGTSVNVSPMRTVLDHPSATQRAWGHHHIGYNVIGPDPKEAERHLLQAIELQPTVPVFHFSYAYFLVTYNRCDEAEPYLAYATSKGQFSSALLAAYARCLYSKGRGEEAFIQLWKSRSLFVDDAKFSAALGELSVWTNRTPMARSWLAQAAELSSGKRAPGCTLLFNAILEDPMICDQEKCAAPTPESSMSAEERWCWSAYAHRYGHSFSVSAK